MTVDLVDSDLDPFFAYTSEPSQVKTRIVSKYFFVWARIITRATKSSRVSYIDLYAGPGRYKDGTKSTPLRVLESAIADARMREMLLTLFNDAKPAHAGSLQKAIDALPGIETLKHRPDIITERVGPKLVAALSKPLVPTFAFIDPFGYVGLSLRLVNAVIKDWGSECLFFFNYNRINPGINNDAVKSHMEALFGPPRLTALRATVKDKEPLEREQLIMGALAEAIRELGGRYILPFRFRARGRTSHYLVFVSKEFLGYEIMREVMAKESSSSVEGVASFEYDPADISSPRLFEIGRPLDELGELLLAEFAGMTRTVHQVYERHSSGRPFIKRNYKDALLRLEEAGRALMTPPVDQRKVRSGKSTLADQVLVSFPRELGSRAGVAASRSTLDRPAVARPTSVLGRPTA